MNLELAKLLKKNSRSIIQNWVETLQLHIADYAMRPKSELKDTTDKHLSVILSVFENDDYVPLRAFVNQIAPIRYQLRFSLSNTQRAFILGKKIIQQVVFDHFHQNPASLVQALKDLDEPFNQALYYYADIYQEIQLRELEKQIHKLARAEEERRFLEEIRVEKAKLDLILEALGVDLALIDKDLNVYWRKQALTDRFNHTDSAPSSNCGLCSWLRDRGKIECPTVRCFKSGLPERELIEWSDEASNKRSYEISALPIKVDNKVEKVLELVRDVTDLQNLQLEVNANKELITAVLDNSADAIVGLDRSHRIVLWNKGAEKIFGFSPEEILHTPFDVLLPAYVRARGELEWLSRQIEEYGYVKNHETTCLARDNVQVLVDLSCTPVKNMSNQPLGLSLVIRDITEKKRLENKVLHNERLVTIGHMAAKIAHEVRNPLSSISLNTELLEDELDNFNGQTAEAKSLLNAIFKEVEQLTQLTEEYLHFTKLQAPEFTNTDVNQLLRDLVSFCKPELSKSHIKVTIQFGNELPRISLDREKMRRAVLNLLRNSIEAMPGGGQLLLQTQRLGQMIEIRVRDSGVGIAGTDLPRIFAPFFSTKKTGTGLGLSIAQQIIEEHQGTIDCKSELNKGTEFTIHLPLVSMI